jgi:hypothetical protein
MAKVIVLNYNPITNTADRIRINAEKNIIELRESYSKAWRRVSSEDEGVGQFRDLFLYKTKCVLASTSQGVYES